MRSSTLEPASQTRNLSGWLLTVLPVALIVCLLAISHQSYWIDECGVAYKASLPTLGEFWHKISTEGSADLQQPFHHFFAWGWEKLVGLDEFALRSGNIPFFMTGVAVVICAFRHRPNLLRGMLVVLLLSPFAWLYLNEARPYAVQLGASLTVFASLFRLGEGPDGFRHERRWVVVLCCGMVLLAISGMLAMLWLGAYLLGALAATPKHRLVRLLQAHWLAWAVTALLLLGMGLFYLWTLRIGARATAVGTTDLRNLAFIPYELLGFTGLGPGRLEIRNQGLGAFQPWVALMAPFAGIVAVLIWHGWRGISGLITRRHRVVWLGAFLLVAAFILLVGVAAHFRVLGRHCTPVLPLLLLVLGAGFADLWHSGQCWRKILALCFVGFAIASCLSVRLAQRHGKDNYRDAAALAKTQVETGALVWWNADPEGAAVYRLPLAANPQPAHATWIANPLPGFYTNLTTPEYIFASKPDVYDGLGNLGRYIETRGYQKRTNFNAFTIWQAPASR